MHTFLSKVLQYNDKSGLNKKSFIAASAADISGVEEPKHDSKLIDHRRFLDMRNFISNCVEYRSFAVFGKSGALTSLLSFLRDVLEYFVANPLPAKFSDKFRIIAVRNENVLDDNKYRIIFLLQLKIFVHALDHRLDIHRDAYPEFERRDRRTLAKIVEMADAILRQQRIQNSKRSIADAFLVFEHYENIAIAWKNEGCPSFEFVTSEPDRYTDIGLASRRGLSRRGDE